jgi:hypothetical protein
LKIRNTFTPVVDDQLAGAGQRQSQSGDPHGDVRLVASWFTRKAI